MFKTFDNRFEALQHQSIEICSGDAVTKGVHALHRCGSTKFRSQVNSGLAIGDCLCAEQVCLTHCVAWARKAAAEDAA